MSNIIEIPSYATGFAKCAAESEYPELWQGLVGAWLPFLGPSSKLWDISGHGNHGTIHGATWGVSKFGGALGFNGVDDYVDVSSYSETTNSLTVEAWFKVADLGISASQAIVQQTNVGSGTGRLLLGVRDQTDDVIYTNLGATELSSGVVPILDRWYHGAATFGGNNLKIYVDGVEKASATETLECNDCSLLMSTQKTKDVYFNGTINSVRIYNSSLSAAEIAFSYANPYALVRPRTKIWRSGFGRGSLRIFSGPLIRS